jgi:hypothetical protein
MTQASQAKKAQALVVLKLRELAANLLVEAQSTQEEATRLAAGYIETLAWEESKQVEE